MKCPCCGKSELALYKAVDIKSLKIISKLRCSLCGYYETSEDGEIVKSSNRFTLDFSTTAGDRGTFVGTQKEIWEQIDEYHWIGYSNYSKEVALRNIANNIEILKYGVFDEYRKRDYDSFEFTYDNCLWLRIRYGIHSDRT